MTSFLELARAFAGPITTFIASVTAVGVTAYFASKQVKIAAAQAATAASQSEIAQAQRDIAYDKLKWDLFGKRYEIYSVARDLIEHINSTTFDRPPGGSKIVGMLTKLDEARFFFPPQETLIFAHIDQLVQEHEATVSIRHLTPAGEQMPIEAADRAAQASDILGKLRGLLPKLMERELGFAQLTSRREGHESI
jgi:hypothetical protein